MDPDPEGQRVYCTDAYSGAGLAYTYGTYAHIYAYRGPGNELADRLAEVGGNLEQSTQIPVGVDRARLRAPARSAA